MRLQHFRKTLLFFSFLLFSFTFMYLSPFLALRGTFDKVAASGLIVWALVLILAPLFGRSFCAYLCPLGGLQDCMHGGLEKPLVRARYLKLIKYLMWAGWVGGIAAAAIAKGGWAKVDILYDMKTGFPPYDLPAYIALLGFMLLAALPALFLGRRAFCHHLCFFSPLNIIGSQTGRRLHLPALRVRVVEKGKCKTCHLCSRSCPMSLDVEKMVSSGAINNTECIACGQCSAACKLGVLDYGFNKPQ